MDKTITPWICKHCGWHKSTKTYQFSRKQKIIPRKKLYNFQIKPKKPYSNTMFL